jgi:hypothetical protein
VDECSGWYQAGNITGDVTASVLYPGAAWKGARWLAHGRELTIPFTNGVRVGLGVPGATLKLSKGGGAYWQARVPHYHRQILDDAGNVIYGQGMGRHRPWQGGW